MKNLIKPILTVLIVSGALLTSCKKDFLNTKPLTEVRSEDTWKNDNLSAAFVNEIYNGLGNGGFDEQELASLSDEAVFTHPGRNINIINEGTVGPSNIGWTNNTYEWGSMYNRIRTCNVALQNLVSAPINQSLKERLQGEAHFLRAYYYQQLVRYYGGIPLITKVYKLNEADYSAARNSYADCIKFITTDCDSAITLLTGKTMDVGRATVPAALALKSRVLLYAASDLHDIPTAKAKSAVISAYAHPELLGYISGDRTARWQAAKDAAKAVLDAAGTGYKLDLGSPASFNDAKNNYISIAMGGGSKAKFVDAAAASELIFARYFVAGKDEGGENVGLNNGPNGYHNWAGNTPVENLVSDYENIDGTKFDWSNPANKAAPYKNRDPRLYASILFDGADWKPRDKISGNVDPANQIQTGSYQVGSGTLAGLDTRQSSIENWNGSWTGYYMRKFIDVDPNVVDNNTKQFIPWPFFRYTEAVFNYAEACIELGQDAEARTWLNKIRFRAGMPALTESGDALRQRYRNERRVEMVYEEQRYHDARRWMIAPTTLGRKLVFITITGTLKPGQTAPSPYKHDETIYNYTYTPVIDNSIENRQWLDKMYFLPISLTEVNKNLKLIQNPGYN
ncbi:RagB/SusD family nutrient uptake outer membrane protein [Mucilaginibacter sp. RCC_168]|uniref:RagB/SusD family nutrient uptake outer membrane protein n=1 Tax=Mucilaginibacter sp. RCC_168 TaxID=3239221 RepID=UPI0035257016